MLAAATPIHHKGNSVTQMWDPYHPLVQSMSCTSRIGELMEFLDKVRLPEVTDGGENCHQDKRSSSSDQHQSINSQQSVCNRNVKKKCML